MTDQGYDELVRDLAALGRMVDQPSRDGAVAEAVMARVALLPTPQPRNPWEAALGAQRRWLAIGIAVLALALLATPPVRAAVADWFGFGVVVVETDSPTSESAPPPPEAPAGQSVTEARAAVDFPIVVPALLGTPDGVEVSPDRQRVSMSWSSWSSDVIRLDQFDATLDYGVLKQASDVRFTDVDGADAVWFATPHDVVLLAPDGTQRTETARLVGATLLWLRGNTTLRLEGDLTFDQASEIASSSQPVD